MNDLSLYRIEEHLADLMDTEDAGVPAERLAEFQTELGEYTEAALAKRDNVVRFIRHVESQIEQAREEEKRLAERRHRLEHGLDRFRQYVVNTVLRFASNMRKGPPRLEGRTVTLAAVLRPRAVEIGDVRTLPPDMTHVSLKLSGRAFASLTPEVQDFLKRHAVEWGIEPLKREIAAELKAGRPVPGAKLRPEERRLDIR